MMNNLFYDASTASRGSPTLFEQVDFLRLDANRKLKESHKAAMGQFLTPMPIARFMASLLKCNTSTVHILDAGAGVGSLFAACVFALFHRQSKTRDIKGNSYEIEQ